MPLARLIRDLQNPDLRVRGRAIDRAEQVKPEEATGVLVLLPSDPVPELRAKTAAAPSAARSSAASAE